MSQTRVVRNFIKMTPGTLAGQSRAATPARFRTLGSQNHSPDGTFAGESKVATPVGCNWLGTGAGVGLGPSGG